MGWSSLVGACVRRVLGVEVEEKGWDRGPGRRTRGGASPALSRGDEVSRHWSRVGVKARRRKERAQMAR